MHHYGLENTRITQSFLGTNYKVEFRNSETDATVKMQVPVRGAFENVEREFDREDAERLAEAVSSILSRELGEGTGAFA